MNIGPRSVFFFLSRNTIIASNSLDLNQAQHYVGPDLDPSSLQVMAGKELISHKKTKKDQDTHPTIIIKLFAYETKTPGAG